MPVILRYLIYYLCYICLPIFLISCGMQFAFMERMKRNYAKVSHISDKRLITLQAKIPPIDGWIPTLLVCCIPFQNIAYMVFIILLSLAKTNGKIITTLSNNIF